MLNSDRNTDFATSWDTYYQNDLDNDDQEDPLPEEVAELESWFDDVDAPAKVLAFLTGESFPFSPNNMEGASSRPSVLDIGTGNGSFLLSLYLDSGYRGQMVGVDYSEQSVQLARKLYRQYVSSEGDPKTDGLLPTTLISYEVFDVIRENPCTTSWWQSNNGGFDLVLDKGTFDAISLSSETILLSDGRQKRPSELYPAKIARLTKPGGFFLITSCNWTEDEVIHNFTTGATNGIFTVYDTIDYPSFYFGGQKGQGVVSICFRKVKDP